MNVTKNTIHWFLLLTLVPQLAYIGISTSRQLRFHWFQRESPFWKSPIHRSLNAFETYIRSNAIQCPIEKHRHLKDQKTEKYQKMYFSNRILLSIAFLTVLPIFVGVCLVNCQRILQKFRFLFVIMVTFGMVILSTDVLGQFNMEWKQYQQGFGLMVNNNLEKCAGMGLNGFHITHDN